MNLEKLNILSSQFLREEESKYTAVTCWTPFTEEQEELCSECYLKAYQGINGTFTKLHISFLLDGKVQWLSSSKDYLGIKTDYQTDKRIDPNVVYDMPDNRLDIPLKYVFIRQEKHKEQLGVYRLVARIAARLDNDNNLVSIYD